MQKEDRTQIVIENAPAMAPPMSVDFANKLERARLIHAELLHLLAESGRLIPAACSGGRQLSRYYEQAPCKITLTENCSLTLLSRCGNLFEERRVFDTGWDLLELVVSGRRKFALHMREDEIELVEFAPGDWERRFGAEPGADTTAFKIPYVPKSLREMEHLVGSLRNRASQPLGPYGQSRVH
jgi:hypothetical protein